MVGGCRYDEPSTEAFIPLKFTVFLLKAQLNFKTKLIFSIHLNFKIETTIDEKNLDKYSVMKHWIFSVGW